MKCTCSLCAGVLLIVTLASCAAPAKKPEAKDAKGKDIEYVYITRTGSNVPIKVPKDQANVTDYDNDASNRSFLDVERNGEAGTPKSPGGK